MDSQSQAPTSGLNSSDPELFRSWYRDVIEIKDLFYSRKYKRCVARCEELQSSAVHPIHKTYLNFYQALSYESIGIAAHVYSTNKLTILNQAKNCFDLALQNLPEPFVRNEELNIHDVFESPQPSPDCATLDIVKRYQLSSPLTETSVLSPIESCFSDSLVDVERKERGNELGRHGSISSAYSEDDDELEDVSSPCQDNFERPDLNMLDPELNHLTIINDDTSTHLNLGTPNHRSRLSQSMSSTHCLADELVPSPLFKRSQKAAPDVSDAVVAATSRSESLGSAQVHGDVDTVEEERYTQQENSEAHQDPGINSEEEQQQILVAQAQAQSSDDCQVKNAPDPSAIERPLPPLPFNHKPTFIKRGSRCILVPSTAPVEGSSKQEFTTPVRPRASAIQTLVAKFEGKILDSAVSLPLGTPFPKTPITPRFDMIKNTFNKKPTDSDEYNIVGQPEANGTVLPNANTMFSERGMTSGIPTSRISTPASIEISDSASTASVNQFQDEDTVAATVEPPHSSNQKPPLPHSDPNPVYTSSLLSFRTSLHSHLDSITRRIARVGKTQEDRRLRGVPRDMSFWSFDVKPPSLRSTLPPAGKLMLPPPPLPFPPPKLTVSLGGRVGINNATPDVMWDDDRDKRMGVIHSWNEKGKGRGRTDSPQRRGRFPVVL